MEFEENLQQNVPKNSLCVDLTTQFFSAQRLFESALKEKQQFVYWGVSYAERHEYANEFNWTSFGPMLPRADPKVFTEKGYFLEFLMTSPEPPIIFV